MATKEPHQNKADVEQKRRQDIERKKEYDGNQEETGGPGSEAKQQNQEADGQRRQGRDPEKPHQRG